MLAGYAKWAWSVGCRRRIDAPDVKLRFNLLPPTRAYLYTAYASGILTANGPTPGADIHYLQLCFNPGEPNALEFWPRLDLWNYQRLGRWRIASWDAAATRKTGSVQVQERIAAALVQGRYVHLFVDEFFIPESRVFLRRHLRHEHLVFGFDAKEQSFIGASYLRSDEFGVTRTPVGLMGAAMESRGGRLPDWYSNSDIVWELEPAAASQGDGGPGVLIRALTAYLEGTRGAAMFLSAVLDANGVSAAAVEGFENLQPRAGDVLGVDVYAPLLELLLAACGRRNGYDLRATRLLWEHKAILKRCLEELLFRCGINAAGDTAADLRRMAGLGRKVHLLAYEDSQYQSAGEIEATLRDLAGCEQRCISRILEQCHGAVAAGV